MPEFAPDSGRISRLEKRRISVDCRGQLDGNQTIEGASLSVTEKSTSHLGITEVAVSSAPLEINKQTVPTGQAIQFMCDARGGSVKELWPYALVIEFDTADGERVAGGIYIKTD